MYILCILYIYTRRYIYVHRFLYVQYIRLGECFTSYKIHDKKQNEKNELLYNTLNINKKVSMNYKITHFTRLKRIKTERLPITYQRLEGIMVLLILWIN